MSIKETIGETTYNFSKEKHWISCFTNSIQICEVFFATSLVLNIKTRSSNKYIKLSPALEGKKFRSFYNTIWCRKICWMLNKDIIQKLNKILLKCANLLTSYISNSLFWIRRNKIRIFRIQNQSPQRNVLAPILYYILMTTYWN